MASIPGAQFTVSVPGQSAFVGETSGGSLPPPVANAFNLEVWTGTLGTAPNTPAPGYQGLAVIADGGLQLDLISGVFAITDQGAGNDTVNMYGADETVSGGANNVTVNDHGSNDVVNGGGQDTISVFGHSDTVNGGPGNDTINVFGHGDSVNGGAGAQTINVHGNNDTVGGGSGNDTINVMGQGDSVNFTTGDQIDLVGFAFDPTNSVTLLAGNMLQIIEGGQTYNLQLDPGTNYGGDDFVLSADGSGTAITIGASGNSGLSVADTATDQPLDASAQPYSGPVSGLQEQFIYSGSDGINVSLSTDNWFIHTGSGDDAVALFGGDNVVDGGTGSNFLTGGTGTDTFFIDDRGPSTDIWSTVNNFHAGDAVTIFGITPNGETLTWVDGQGASGFTGLTLHVTAPGMPTASLTLVGFTTADLTNGNLTVEFGTESDGTPYLYILDSGTTPATPSGSSPSSIFYSYQSGQLVNAGSYGQVNLFGGNDTVVAGGNSTIDLVGPKATIVDGTQPYHDTVVGFTEGQDHLNFAGENAQSEAQIIGSSQVVNGNTILTLPDHSTITLVGVTHIDTGIFG
jgi:Ca2+-binding RTX toxin-like protein